MTRLNRMTPVTNRNAYNPNRFTPSQRTILIFCMIAYSILYFMRLNISLSLTEMGQTFSVDPDRLGTISSAFFWCYACGQLVFGFLGDRLPVRWMVFIGLFASALLNFGVSLADNVTLITLLWGLNGVFQSMLWSPMVRCVAKNFEGDKKVIASFALSITQVIGYMVAWVGSYFIQNAIGWRGVFRIPAATGLAFAIVWAIFFRYSSVGERTVRKKGSSLMRHYSIVSFLAVIALFSVLFGLVKSSIDTWFPTLISDVGSLSEGGIVITLFLVPLVNFLGIMVAKAYLKKLRGDVYKTILVIWCISAAISGVALLLFRVNTIVFVCSIAVLFGFVYGLTSMFTSFIPLDFAKWDCVSTVTGFVDFAIYVGAGITGTVSGIILGQNENKNWQGLGLYWFVLLLIGTAFAVATYIWHHRLRRKISREDAEWD